MATAYKFNPGFHSDEETIKGFVVRQRELSLVLGELRKPPTLDFERPNILITAPRGAGKTTLCRRIAAEVRASADLREQWHPLFLGEESYTVTSPGEFFLECVFHLQDETQRPHLIKQYTSLRALESDEDLAMHAADVLDKFALESNRKLLLIVENLHMLLSDQIGPDGRERFLSLLNARPSIRLLATSVAGVDDRALCSGADGFIEIRLDPLSLEECRILWEFLTGEAVKDDRVRPLQILTGGSPRLLHILADFTKDASLRSLIDKINYLVDQNTEYFKSQLDSLPSLERKIFVALLDRWDPSSAKEVAEYSRVSVNTASSMLSRLYDRGAVVKEPGQGRAIIYYASERLFNIYYLMRRRNRPSSRVKALVSFMTLYYDRDELVDTTAKLAVEACKVDPAQRGDYHIAFSEILSNTSESLQAKIIAKAPDEFLKTCPIPMHRGESVGVDGEQRNEAAEAIDRAWDADDTREALRLAEEAYHNDSADWDVLWRLAVLRLVNGNSAGAIEAAQETLTIDASDAATRTVMGLGFLQEGHVAEARNAFEEALVCDPKSEFALLQLAQLELGRGDVGRALDLFRRIDSEGPSAEEAAVGAGTALVKLGRVAEAEEELREAMIRQPKWRLVRRVLLDCLQGSGRAPEALEILQAAVKEFGDPEDWTELGLFILHSGGDIVEAERALQRALDEGTTEPTVYWHLAKVGKMEKRPSQWFADLVEDLQQRAPNEDNLWLAAGDIYRMGGLNDRAENAYRRGSTSEGGRACWARLARMLGKDPDRLDDAKQLVRDALAQDAKCLCLVGREIAEALTHKGEDAIAEPILAEVINANSRCSCCLVLSAQIARRCDEKDRAEELYRRALVVDPERIPALTGLAELVDVSEAADLIHRAALIAPDDPRCLVARARLHQHDPEAALRDLREALEVQPDLPEERLYLASLEARSGYPDDALESLKRSVAALPTQRELLPAVVDAAVQVARLGSLDRLLEVFSDPDVASCVEPLVVALRLAKGERLWVAKEVMEVAKDILKRIKNEDERLLI